MKSRILWKGSKKISKESRIGQPCQTHSDQGKTFQNQKEKKKRWGAAYHLPMFTHAHTHTHTKKNLRSDISDSLTVNWGGEKASPSFLFRLPPNQNLKNAEKPKERQVCPCNAYTTRAPSACASKLLYPQNGGVGAWAIHGIWWIKAAQNEVKNALFAQHSAHCGVKKMATGIDFLPYYCLGS